MATLRLHGVRKEFGKVVALDGLDLDIADGEFFSSLDRQAPARRRAQIVAGLEQPTAGRVEIGDRDVSDVEPSARRVAMAFENYALYPQETVYDNIAFPLRSKRYYRSPADAKTLSVKLRRHSASTICWSDCRANCRAGSGSGSRWRASSSARRTCCCSTSRFPTSTPNCAPRCGPN